MKLQGEYTFDAPQDIVWEALQDPNVLGSVLPGGQGFEAVPDTENEYVGQLNIKVGPVNGKFDGKIQLSDINPPDSYTVAVDGSGAPGFVKGEGSLRLEPRGEQTWMEYSGEANVGGKIASVGQRLIDTSAKSIIRQALAALNEYLKVQVAQRAAEQAAPPVAAVSDTTDEDDTAPAPAAPANAAPPVPEYKPPSQTTLAMNVAKDVWNDMVPAQAQPFVIGGGIAIIALILWLIFGH